MLKHKIVLYVPSTNYNKKITARQFAVRTKAISLIFASMFGGATIERVSGAYKANSGELISEDINKVIAYTDKPQHIIDIAKLAKEKAREWKQESIAVETNQGMAFIN